MGGCNDRLPSRRVLPLGRRHDRRGGRARARDARGLPAAIPELRAYQYGHDAGAADGNYDFAVIADFDDREGWLAYQRHDAHQPVLDYVRSLATDRVAVQFELDG